MSSRKETITLEIFLKRAWPLLLCGAVLILGVSACLIYLTISGKIRSGSIQTEPANAGTSSTVGALAPRHLDGVLVPSDQVALQAYAVMIDNLPEARPLSGPAKANLVIEAPVEGGITRFMLLFDATSTAAEIGPVRSARNYFVDWAYSLGAVYAHVGGSPSGLELIRLLTTFRNLDEMSSGSYFWRSTARSRPHNTYTDIASLKKAALNKEWAAGALLPWSYATSSLQGTTQLISVPYEGSYYVEWRFSTSTGKYQRYQDDKIQKDADGTYVTASNVVVVLTDATVVDSVGRLNLRTKGNGTAVLYRNGEKYNLTWSRQVGEWIKFKNAGGNDAVFEPGTTWVEIFTDASLFNS